MKIEQINAHLFSVPALTKRTDAIQSFTHMELLLVELMTVSGLHGVGYGYTIGTGGHAAKAFLEHELSPLLLGEDCQLHDRIWQKLLAATRASSGGPISSIARAAVDIAVWDIKAKACNVPLYKALGGAQERVPVYDTEGGWLHLSIEELVHNAELSLERGFRGIKLKVGRESAAEDVRRIEAVRKKIGPDVKLMVDANQGWAPAEAIRRANLFQPYDLFWLEEPIPATSVSGHRALREHTSIPIAVGETLYSKVAFAEYLQSNAASILQPDVARVGGITEWMKIAAMAEAFHVSVAPHFLMEIQIHLAAAVPNGIFIEYIPQLGPVLEEEMALENGYFRAPEIPGHGIRFAWKNLEKYRI